MEVVVPPPPPHNFSSTTSSPYISAPSSPKLFADPFDYYFHYTSAPSSPTHVAAILAASRDHYGWDDKSFMTNYPSGGGSNDDNVDDFAFDFSGQLEKDGHLPDVTAADELFEEGKIRPLNKMSAASSPRSQRGAASRGRGRERGPASPSNVPSSSGSRKGSRSLSPMRSGVGSLLQEADNAAAAVSTTTARATKTIASECLKNNSSGSRKWRLRDLLLFRSASEGRTTGNKSKDPLRKFTVAPSSPIILTKNGGADSRNSSFVSAGSVGGSMRRAKVSAHEVHYTSKRAASGEMKRRTALPFSREGLFGGLRFNPALNSIAKCLHNGYSFSPRQ